MPFMSDNCPVYALFELRTLFTIWILDVNIELYQVMAPIHDGNGIIFCMDAPVL